MNTASILDFSNLKPFAVLEAIAMYELDNDHAGRCSFRYQVKTKCEGSPSFAIEKIYGDTLIAEKENLRLGYIKWEAAFDYNRLQNINLDSFDARQLCPTIWRIPSFNETSDRYSQIIGSLSIANLSPYFLRPLIFGNFEAEYSLSLGLTGGLTTWKWWNELPEGLKVLMPLLNELNKDIEVFQNLRPSIS